jgi:imidazolonepropionase-like amidohydrolase
MSAREDLVRRLRMYAMYGVTTVVSLGSTKGDEAETFRLRDEQENAPLDRARVYSSGLVVNDPSADAARRSVARLAGAGADFIKFRLNGGPGDMAPDTWGALVDEAKRRRIPTAVHVFYLQDAKAAVARGVDVIAHSVRDQDVDPAFIAALKQGNIAYIPTLTRELSVFAYESTPAFFADPFFRRGFALYEGEVERLSDPAAQARVRENPQSQAIKKALEQANRNLATLAAAGVPIALGTDSGAAGAPGRWQGYFEHVELEMMVRAGLSPRDAVVAATAAAARAMRLEDVGTIEPGKWGDLLVLRGNPLDDIMHMRQIDAVWIAGRQLSF